MVQEKLRSASIIANDEDIIGVVEELYVRNTLQMLEKIWNKSEQRNWVVLVE